PRLPPRLSSPLPPATSTLFPYTTLFRSVPHRHGPVGEAAHRADLDILRPVAGRVISHVVGHRDAVGGRLTTARQDVGRLGIVREDRKSTRLNSSHQIISYAFFFLKNKYN